MPVPEHKPNKLETVVYWLSFAAVFIGAVCGIVRGYGALYNCALGLAFSVWTLIGSLFFQSEKALAYGCREHGYAVVDSIRECDGCVYVTLLYYVDGIEFRSEVCCRRRYNLEVGQEVGIYYDPDDFGTCMLARYKRKFESRKEV